MGYSGALFYACAFAAAIGLAVPASAELTKTDTIVGDWHVYSDVDNMTDEKKCAAFYKDDPFIQLSPGALYFSYRGRGGVKFYKYRVGDGEPVIGPRGRYSSADYISISGGTLTKALEAKRIRLQVLTYVRGTVDEDVDLTEAGTVLAAMTAIGCAD